MKHNTQYNNMKTIERTIESLCYEIDELREAVLYWKEKYEIEVAENIRQTNERIEYSRKGIGQALMLALHVKDNPDGSLSISKEDRKSLAKSFN